MDTTAKWQEELAILKSIIEKTALIKTIKWGADVYTHNGKNVVSSGGFKDHFTLWFYNGVFLEDKQKVLINAQDGKTKALRQWRFTSKDEINEKLILRYIQEAIKNVEDDKIWKPQKSLPPQTPAILSNAFVKNKRLKSAFEKLAPYKQKDYIEYIDTAKREETKLARVEKIKPMIMEGIGLNDQYKS